MEIWWWAKDQSISKVSFSCGFVVFVVVVVVLVGGSRPTDHKWHGGLKL